MTSYEIHSKMAMQIHSNALACHKTSSTQTLTYHCRGALPLIQLGVDTTRLSFVKYSWQHSHYSLMKPLYICSHWKHTPMSLYLPVCKSFLSCRRRSGIAGAGLSLYARLISHFNITNIVILAREFPTPLSGGGLIPPTFAQHAQRFRGKWGR